MTPRHGAPRVALVLGAGGLAGTAFHAGVVTALWRECGWDSRQAALIVGTSAGSMTAALLRAGLPPEDFLLLATNQPPSAAGAAVLRDLPPTAWAAKAPTSARRSPAAPEALLQGVRRPWRVRAGAMLSAALPAGRIPSAPMGVPFDSLHRRWPDRPMWLCAVRLRDGQRMVFGRGSNPTVTVGEAVASSCAIPGYFAPMEVDGERYVDGAAHSFCNADLAAGQDVDAVVISAPMSSTDRFHRGADLSWRAVGRLQLGSEVRRLVSSGLPVLVLHPSADDRLVMRGGSLDPRKQPAIARQALASVSGWLDSTAHPVVGLLRGEPR